MDVPFGTCDWGGCDELAVARRRCPCCDDELPVCDQHRTAEIEVLIADDPDVSEWWVRIDGTGTNTSRDGFKTPGAALDWVHKWCAQRGYEIPVIQLKPYRTARKEDK
jgi:hypothetical protein